MGLDEAAKKVKSLPATVTAAMQIKTLHHHKKHRHGDNSALLQQEEEAKKKSIEAALLVMMESLDLLRGFIKTHQWHVLRKASGVFILVIACTFQLGCELLLLRLKVHARSQHINHHYRKDPHR